MSKNCGIILGKPNVINNLDWWVVRCKYRGIDETALMSCTYPGEKCCFDYTLANPKELEIELPSCADLRDVITGGPILTLWKEINFEMAIRIDKCGYRIIDYRDPNGVITCCKNPSRTCYMENNLSNPKLLVRTTIEKREICADKLRDADTEGQKITGCEFYNVMDLSCFLSHGRCVYKTNLANPKSLEIFPKVGY